MTGKFLVNTQEGNKLTIVARWMFIARRELVGSERRNKRMVAMALPEDGLAPEIKLQRKGPDDGE
jgi:hypothetical protein